MIRVCAVIAVLGLAACAPQPGGPYDCCVSYAPINMHQVQGWGRSNVRAPTIVEPFGGGYIIH